MSLFWFKVLILPANCKPPLQLLRHDRQRAKHRSSDGLAAGGKALARLRFMGTTGADYYGDEL